MKKNSVIEWHTNSPQHESGKSTSAKEGHQYKSTSTVKGTPKTFKCRTLSNEATDSGLWGREKTKKNLNVFDEKCCIMYV